MKECRKRMHDLEFFFTMYEPVCQFIWFVVIHKSLLHDQSVFVYVAVTDRSHRPSLKQFSQLDLDVKNR